MRTGGDMPTDPASIPSTSQLEEETVTHQQPGTPDRVAGTLGREQVASDQQTVMGWLAPGTWPAVVRALATRPTGDALVLVSVADDTDDLPPTSLFGRGRRHDPHPASETLSQDAAERLLQQAARALGRDCRAELLHGRTERVVVEAAQHVDRLVLARDGDRSRLGPPSLGRHARFVIDHAPCTVEVVWPERAPSVTTIPAPPR